MVRPLGATLLPDKTVDVDGDGVGDFCPEDSDCYGGGDEPISLDDVLKGSATGVGIMSWIIDFIKDFTKTQADNKLQQDMKKASDKINSGKDGMADAGGKIDSASQALFGENQNISGLASDLFSLGNTASNQLSTLNSLATSISGFQNTLQQQTLALNDANARLDYAMNRANYPAGIKGLQQQRADARSANSDILNISTAKLQTESSLSSLTAQSTTVGSQYNQTLSQISSKQSDLVSAYDRASTFQNALNSGVNQWNQSAKTYSDGVNDVRSGVNNYQNTINNTVVPLAETASGLSGASKVLSAVSEQKYGQATAEALKSGLNQAIISGAPPELSMVKGLAGAVIDSAGKAVDRGGDPRQGMLNFAQAVGDATIRVSDMVKIGQNLSLANTILNNPTNPNRVYDASQVVVQQVGTAVQVGGTITQTVSSVVPGAQALSPLIGVGVRAGAPIAQGLAQTTVEAVNQLSQGRVFGNLTPGGDQLSAFPVGGRQIGNRPAGYTPGSTGAVETIVGGSLVSMIQGGKAVTIGLVQNQNYANQASAMVNAIANTGLGGKPLPPGSVTIRTGME